MTYRIKDPSTVLSPLKNVGNVDVIFNSGNDFGCYSVALLEWNKKKVIGIRWNITENESSDQRKINGEAECLGEPNSRGNATWFILPNDFLSCLLDDSLDFPRKKMLNAMVDSRLDEWQSILKRLQDKLESMSEPKDADAKKKYNEIQEDIRKVKDKIANEKLNRLPFDDS